MNKGTIIQIVEPDKMGMPSETANKLAVIEEVVEDNGKLRWLEAGYSKERGRVKLSKNFHVTEAWLADGCIHIVL